ncbi:MAG: hypothetical protein AAGB15_01820 [Pseudomonadota bacterium]
MTDLIYLGGGFAALLALCVVLVVIGRAAAECPQLAGAAKVGTLVITTGFAAIGTGIIALIGAALPFLMTGQVNGLYLALGMVSIALGIGFYNAATTLRDLLRAARPMPDPLPATDAVPAG